MLGRMVKARIDRPAWSLDRKTHKKFELNCGVVDFYCNGELKQYDAYIIGVKRPMKFFSGRVIAVVKNQTENDILVIAPAHRKYIIHDIRSALSFLELSPKADIECLYERSCGAVVYSVMKKEVRFLIIKNNRSLHWGFPKGHVEFGETDKETAIREVREETGIDIEIIKGFSCTSEYKIHGHIEKTVVMFLGVTDNTRTVIQQEEIEDYNWLTFQNAMDMLKFDNDKVILRRAEKYLRNKGLIS